MYILIGFISNLFLNDSDQFDGNPFIPGSSTLSALGINGLPPSSQISVLARSVISEESAETASRLARPPSVQSNLRLYEKRRKFSQDPYHPSIPEQDTPSTSMRCKDQQSAEPYQKPFHFTRKSKLELHRQSKVIDDRKIHQIELDKEENRESDEVSVWKRTFYDFNVIFLIHPWNKLEMFL